MSPVAPQSVVTLPALQAGIKAQETGGQKDPYKTVNSIGATGAYQVMTANVGPWTKKALGRSLTVQQWLNDPAAQDRTVAYVLGGYYRKYGPEGAAAMWYSGQPDPTKTYGTPSVKTYVQQVMSKARAWLAKGGASSTGGTSSTGGGASSTGASSAGLVSSLTGISQSASSIGSSLTQVGAVATMLTKLFLPQTMTRVACGVAGSVLVVLGLVALAREVKE